tara:strand:+ start:695 stop:1072 length:378 start_codon:yes stop_codon:yes gene_type:complete
MMTKQSRRDVLRRLVSQALDEMPLELFTTSDMAAFIRSGPGNSRSVVDTSVSRLLAELVAVGDVTIIGKVDPTGYGSKVAVYTRTRSTPPNLTERSYEWLWDQEINLTEFNGSPFGIQNMRAKVL